VRGQRHDPAAFYSRERPCTNCTGGWEGRTGQVREISPSQEFQNGTKSNFLTFSTTSSSDPYEDSLTSIVPKDSLSGTKNLPQILFIPVTLEAYVFYAFRLYLLKSVTRSSKCPLYFRFHHRAQNALLFSSISITISAHSFGTKYYYTVNVSATT
jgi:hypothetical protein